MAEEILPCKQCSGCLLIKPTNDFSPHVNTKDRFQPKCKSCRREIANIKYSKKPRKPRKPQEQRGRKEYSADRRRDDKKRHYQANRDAVIKRSLKWAKDNAAVMAARAMHRLALQRNATPSWADLGEISKFYEESKRREIETGVKWHVDHSVPLKSKIVCGLHVQHNLVLMTASENIAKGNRIWPDMP